MHTTYDEKADFETQVALAVKHEDEDLLYALARRIYPEDPQYGAKLRDLAYSYKQAHAL